MSVKVIVDGKNINFPDQKPRIISGTTLIPISLVLKEMGYTITDWRLNNLGNLQIAPTGTMIAEKGSNKIIIDEAKQIFISNGLRFSYESLSYAYVVGGRVMLPLRKVLESLGCEVDWEKSGDDDIITVTTNPLGYTLKFDPNGGDMGSQNESLTVLAYTPLALPVPTRKGYVFEGWYTEKEDGTRIGGADDEFTVRANLTLYAKWISIVGYFKIKNAEGKYLTYVGKSNDPITVEAANDAATQIWKIELSSEDDKYHIRPVKFSTLAMNVYRSGDYPCTIQPTAGNIEDTSFSIGCVQDLNCTVNWGGTHYLTESSDKAYWTETKTPQEWTLEPTSYTPPEPIVPTTYICYGNKASSLGKSWMDCADERSLDNLIFTNIVDEEYINNSFLFAFMDHGCVLTCISMMLRNKGITTSGKYDYRFGTYNNTLVADPYSVGMANLFANDIDKWSSTNTNVIVDPSCGGDPFSAVYGNINAAFGVNINYPKTLPNNLVNEADVAQYIHDTLQSHPEGIMIGFTYKYGDDYTGTHSIVVTNSTYTHDTPDINSCFTVCDPVKGEQTTFSGTWIYKYIKNITDTYRVGWIE